MASTSRGKTPRKRPRRKQPGLGQFFLWALVTWILQRSHYRKTHNPFAAPAARKASPRPQVAPPRVVGRPAPARRAAPRKAPAGRAARPAAPKPMYGPYDPDLILDAEIIEMVADEDVSIDDDSSPEPEGDYWMEPVPAAIEGGSGE